MTHHLSQSFGFGYPPRSQGISTGQDSVGEDKK